MSFKEYEPLIRSLLQRTTRLFYDHHHSIIIDILLHNLILYDYELISLLKILSKEFNKLVVRLKEDKLIKIENKIENVDGRQIIKTLYYLDFCVIKDVIKYKMHRMLQSFEIVDSEMYFCNICKKEFTLLEVQVLMVNYKFLCDECKGELVEKSGSAKDIDLKVRMMNCISEMLELCRRLDKFDIESMDYFQVLKLREERENRIEEKKEEIKEEEKFEEIVYESGFAIMQDVNNNYEKSNFNEDVKVFVNGKEKLFNEITEEDKEIMTAEEYEKYFEVFETHQFNL
ncbi:hypothetical protein GVAV_000690 [Gurleya vavrai]